MSRRRTALLCEGGYGQLGSQQAVYQKSRSPRPSLGAGATGAFSAAERDRAIKSLNRDSASWIVLELTTELAPEAQSLLVRHGLRTGDAIQLASCMYLQRETGQRIPFAAFDARLNDAARNEGLTLLSFT